MVGDREYPRGEPTQSLERGAIVLPCLSHHQEVVPVDGENSLHPRSDALNRQDIHAMLPVQGSRGFSEVKEDLIEDLLPHLGEYLPPIV